MSAITIKFGGYQKEASIHNRAAARFGAALAARLGERVHFELIGSVLDRGGKSGDLPLMVESGELGLCYISTVRFTPAVPELSVLELPFVVKDRATVHRAFAAEFLSPAPAKGGAGSKHRLLPIVDHSQESRWQFWHFAGRYAIKPSRFFRTAHASQVGPFAYHVRRGVHYPHPCARHSRRCHAPRQAFHARWHRARARR